MTNKQMTAQEQIAMLREALIDAETRMTRARRILTDGNPRPECNWGMLDTSSVIMPTLAATNQPPEAEVDKTDKPFGEYEKFQELHVRFAPDFRKYSRWDDHEQRIAWEAWQARAALKGK